MENMRLAHDFEEFLKSLNANAVEYLIIGGYAVAFHGFPRTTGDLDIWVAMEPTNAERLASTLRQFGFDTPEVRASLFQTEDRIIRMGVPPMRIDILTTISGVRFEECFPHRVEARIGTLMVNFIDLRNLRVNKLATGRHKDLADLEELPDPDKPRR